jgi:hypothetical protein
MAKNKLNENENEAPMKLGAGFGIKILLIAFGLICLIVGIPYFLMHK